MALDRFATAAAFPLGGIGTGNVAVGARGELRDWELANHPDKGAVNPFTFFAIHAAPQGADPVTRVLESRLPGPHGFEQGYAVPMVAGLPRLAGSSMRGEYPLLTIDFEDEVLPVRVSLEAFTPLIPLETDDSGIPAAVLRYRVTNPTDVPVSVTIAGSISNPVGSKAGPHHEVPDFDGTPFIERRTADGLTGLFLGSDLASDDLRTGDLTLATSDESVTVKRQWLVGFWQDGVQSFWNDLRDDGLLADEPVFTLDTDLPPLHARMTGATVDDLPTFLPKLRTGSLGIVHELAPGEERVFEFVLGWSFPNRPTGWVGHVILDDPNAGFVMKNHYATRFGSSWDAAAYLSRELPRLEKGTRGFHDALWNSSLHPAVIDAVASNISALRSTTCFRLEDGTFAAWEGSFDHRGSCEGTCTHVWSYAQTVAHLFPDLERSARRIEFLLETDDDGAMQFRTNRIFGGPSWGMLPAVDGQMGSILRLYREWAFSGDDAFLAELWPAATRAIDYAIGQWDTDGDGLLDARMHNTYDIEFDGEEPLANVYFLAALTAFAAMASHLGDPRADDYRRAAVRSSARTDEVLYNGEYYQQRIEDVDAHRYQYGTGVLSDQLLGQSLAHVVGLGHVLPVDHVRSAISAVFRYNFRHDLSSHESTQRTYALGDEGGLLLASWPHGGRPRIPFVYSDEVWTGVEYQVAAHLIYEGFVDEGLEITRTTRARHNGTNRNPWNEAECGNHYARSMASWSLLLALTGCRWHAPTATLSFAPATVGTREFFFSTGTGWGRAVIEGSDLTLHVDHGSIELRRVLLTGNELTLPEGGVALGAGDSIRLAGAGALD
ncbi:non-lysosomal glucosylceramidase [soil metagenome]